MRTERLLQPMNHTDWEASVARGNRGEAIVALNLCGKAFWGSSVKTHSTYWDKRTVCKAQNWENVTKRAMMYDFEISCPACKECEYFSTCDSGKPYLVPIIKEKHEVKTNFSTHMKPNDGEGLYQNIYIELFQNYGKWLETGKDKHLGWYHEKHKQERPNWYHFYQPIEDFKGDGKYSSTPTLACKSEIAAFYRQAEPGDSLVIALPWGYIFSITAEALERLIKTIEISYAYDRKYKVEIAILIPARFIKPNNIDIIYTPVFNEINIQGQFFTDNPVKNRCIPERLERSIRKKGDIVRLNGDRLFTQKGYEGLAEISKETIDYAMEKGYLFQGEKITPPIPHMKRQPQFTKNGIPVHQGKGGIIWPTYHDLLQLKLIKGGGEDELCL